MLFSHHDFHLPFIILALIVLTGCGSSPQPGIALPEFMQQEDGYLVQESGRPVLFYQLAPKALDGSYERSNYIHPLYGLDGEILTEDFPEDHHHHRGVYWTWHQVRIGDVRAGDPWLAQRFKWQLLESEVSPAGNGLRTKHHWLSPDYENAQKPILEETAEILVHPAEAQLQKIDFDIRLIPLQDDFRLGGSEDDKGYGGFSIRVKPLQDLAFLSSGGTLKPQRLAMEAGDWVDFSADFGGQGTPSGVAVLVHPDSAGYPQNWVLRSSDMPSMQNPVWPGAEAMPLSKGEEVRLRYRLVVHRSGDIGPDFDNLTKEFAALP